MDNWFKNYRTTIFGVLAAAASYLAAHSTGLTHSVAELIQLAAIALLGGTAADAANLSTGGK